MVHAYEAVASDVIARYRHSIGAGPVYFFTGSDEHGQKISETAARDNKTPMEICDTYCMGFRVPNQRILISNDDYIRTTISRHERTAQQLWNLCAKNDDIYLDTYSG